MVGDDAGKPELFTMTDTSLEYAKEDGVHGRKRCLALLGRQPKRADARVRGCSGASTVCVPGGSHAPLRSSTQRSACSAAQAPGPTNGLSPWRRIALQEGRNFAWEIPGARGQCPWK